MATPRELVEYAGYRALFALLRSLPPGTAHRLGKAVSRRYFDLGDRRARFALANLRVAFPELPETDRRAIGRESFAHMGWNLVEVARSHDWGAAELARRVEFSGTEHLRSALARGRGVLVLTPHLGNFELAVAAAPLLDIHVVVIGRPLPNPLIRRHMAELRTRTGARFLLHRNVALSVLRELRQGHVLVAMNDQYARRGKDGVLAPFFGARCYSSAGLATLAFRSRAPVVPFYVTRESEDRHRACFLPEVAVAREGDLRRDVRAATARFNAVLEGIIRKHPEQWMWSHRRFRHSPDLPRDLYV